MGVDCAHDRGARYQAVLALTELARELLPFDGPEKELTVRVRLNDAVAFSVRLTFDTSFGPALTDSSVIERSDPRH